MTIRYDGQVAIVTGSGNGLGRSHALALAARGAKVVVNDLGGSVNGDGGSSDAALETVAMIEAAGGEAIANGANVAKMDEVEAMVAQAVEKWGRVDILVNNAGILSIIPVRKNSSSKSELVSQLIYGELFEVIEKKEKWFYIESIDDKYCGWINYSQLKEISKQDFKKVKKTESKLLNNISSEIETENGNMSITIGSKVSSAFILNHKLKQEYSKNSIIENSLKFLNSPYLWGGRTPYGIDCSGFSQQIYKLNGFQLPRDANQQALQGKEVKLEKAKPGDLAFFGEKKITHVGIIIDSNKIVHAFGCVRIDYLNEKGIINSTSKKITHYLKKINSY